MGLVKVSKVWFQKFRENGLEISFNETNEFCLKNSISILGMKDLYVARGRSRGGAGAVTNKDYYRTGLFYTVIDAQIVELNGRGKHRVAFVYDFLSPSNFFFAFYIKKNHQICHVLSVRVFFNRPYVT